MNYECLQASFLPPKDIVNLAKGSRQPLCSVKSISLGNELFSLESGGFVGQMCELTAPLSSEVGICATVKARFWPLLVPRGRDTRQEDLEGSPTQSRISPSI